MFEDVFRLRRKADNELTFGTIDKKSRDVIGRRKVEGESLVLLHLLRLRFGGRVVSDRRSLDDDRSLVFPCEHRIAHLGRSLDSNYLNIIRCLQRNRAAHEYDFGSATGRILRQRISHLSRGAIRDITNGIDRLACWAGSDQERFTSQVLSCLQYVEYGFGNRLISG